MRLRRTRTGFALVAVLLVLMALLALSAPFLLTARNADASSARLTDDALARVALDAAARHARTVLAGSHVAVDPTPGYDARDELYVDNRFAPGFLDANDPEGVMWDVATSDLAGRIDPSSAPPQLFANLLGGVTRLAESVEGADARLTVASPAGFQEAGFAWLGGELIGWAELGPSSFERVLRGLGAGQNESSHFGPRPPMPHALGAPIVDQVAWAFAEWRLAGPNGWRAFDGIDALADVRRMTLAEALPPSALSILARTTDSYAAERAGARWQRGTRIVDPVRGGSADAYLLRVRDPRWFNAGTTVRIEGARGQELRLVRRASAGLLELNQPLRSSYDAYDAVVRPLARRPVNLNTASAEVLHALFVNLELSGATGWVTPSEADQLAASVLEARPIRGFEDFLRRVLLPAAGLAPPGAAEGAVAELFAGEEDRDVSGAFLERSDALAVYKNGLNANDAELEFSTVPYDFVSRDVHALELRTVVNAPSGVARTARVREDVQLVVPQTDLLRVWTRQRELDDATRLDGEAAGWISGPENTRRHDGLQAHGRSSDARANLGPYDTAPSLDSTSPRIGLTFASEAQDGFLQLRPSRVDELDTREHLRSGRVLHFDDEARSSEGRWLAEEPLSFSAGMQPITWLDDDGLLRPFTFEAWIQPRSIAPGAKLFEVGGPFTDSDLVSLLVDDGALVARVLGPASDHPETSLEEGSVVRYPLAEGPGLPLDTWTHVSLDVRGDRPDQISLRIDGRLVAPNPGLTWLTSGLSLTDELIPVASTEGFPEQCVLQIGRELVEAQVLDGTSFRARFQEVGELAGHGGRLAREIVFGLDPETNLGEIDKGGRHDEGQSVALYGYSLPLAAHVPAASSRLASELSAFAVARVAAISRGGSPVFRSGMDAIQLQLNDASPTTIGWGWGADSDADGLILDVADPDANLQDVLGAFSESGGYAVVLGPFERGERESTDGFALGGAEVIRYSGMDGERLILDGRGSDVGELANLRGSSLIQPAGFVLDWDENRVEVSGGRGLGPDQRLELQVFVVPISIPAAVDASPIGFYDSPQGSDFAQLTRVGSDAGLTEWVRYDEITRDQLVRDDPQVLEELRRRAHPGGSIDLSANFDELDPSQPKNRSGSTPLGSPGWPGPTASPGPGGPGPSPASGAPRASGGAASASSAGEGFLWQDTLGLPEDADLPLTRALASVLRFRGVLGTHSHAHPRGTSVLPVWKAIGGADESEGWPGRLDAVMLFDGDPAQPGFPGVVQHAHRPFDGVEHSWQPGTTELSALPGPSTLVEESGFDTNATYVALREALGVPIVPEPGPAGPLIGEESRLVARVVLFPSGELPRAASEVTLGTDVGGGGTPPDFLVDEVVFGTPLLYTEQGGSAFVLAQPLAAGEKRVLELAPNLLRTALGDRPQGAPVVAELPQDAALLRVGDEVLCVLGAGSSGRMQLASGGRGLLGTEARAHDAGEPAQFLGGARVSALRAGIGAEDAELPLADVAGFPASGLVLIDRELVHYTHVLGDALAMPRFSREPGERDGRAGGIFRGRFGTEPAGHDADAAVILFPFRYPDRWADRADAPELAYTTLSAAQPSAFWQNVFWQVQEPVVGGPRLGVLQRRHERGGEPPAWDRAPRADSSLSAFLGEAAADEGLPLGFQADRLEWRLFVQHDPGAFDAELGLSHAWKATPRVTLFGTEFFAPHVLLSSSER